MGGGSAGGIHIENINISGVRTADPRSLTAAVRDELIKVGRHNGGKVLG